MQQQYVDSVPLRSNKLKSVANERLDLLLSVCMEEGCKSLSLVRALPFPRSAFLLWPPTPPRIGTLNRLVARMAPLQGIKVWVMNELLKK